MPIKLKISREILPQRNHECKEYEFDKEIITIGRDLKNDLQLESTKSVVSRQHAKITRQDDSYNLTDLNSRNFTFLNNKKLRGGVEYNIQNGDRIKICEFNIQFSIIRSRPEHVEKTIPGPEQFNPFVGDSQALAAILSRICEKYNLEGFGRKDEALQEAIQESLWNLKINKAGEIIAGVLHSQKDTAPIPSDKSDLDLQTQHNFDQIQRLIDILLSFLIKLTHARSQFRVEFIGETMIKSRESFSIYNCTDEELKNFLFDPNIASKESQKRIEQIRDIADEIMLHQVSMLDGYKASVNNGTEQILEKFNPDVLKNQLSKRKSLLGRMKITHHHLPILNIFKLLKLFSDAHHELAQEDQGIIEKKYFRPGYIKSYYKRMDSARKKK